MFTELMGHKGSVDPLVYSQQHSDAPGAPRRDRWFSTAWCHDAAVSSTFGQCRFPLSVGHRTQNLLSCRNQTAPSKIRTFPLLIHSNGPDPLQDAEAPQALLFTGPLATSPHSWSKGINLHRVKPHAHEDLGEHGLLAFSWCP